MFETSAAPILEDLLIDTSSSFSFDSISTFCFSLTSGTENGLILIKGPNMMLLGIMELPPTKHTLFVEHCFLYLDAPVKRVTDWDTPFPHVFEPFYLPNKYRCLSAIKEVINY
uniref:Uncharacterized protein n=1 Tax=Glossina brevipalpis TaxID=37001 RepID=A0A1A9WXE4_9MUSC